jgi:hypothetical protein
LKDLLKNSAFVFALLALGVVAAFAISGGPPYPGSTNVVGTYAGVLIPGESPTPAPTGTPNATPTPTTPTPTPDINKNALGVFSLGVPENGLAVGAFVMFSQGRVFTGNIQGTADPDTAKLRGVLDATFNYTLHDLNTGRSTSVTASVTGDLKATIGNSRFSLQTVSATRLRGNADVFTSLGRVDQITLQPETTAQTLKVRGFKQSDTPTAPVTLATPSTPLPSSPSPSPTSTP